MKTIDEKVDILIDQIVLLTTNLYRLEKKFADYKKFIGSKEDLDQVIRVLKK